MSLKNLSVITVLLAMIFSFDVSVVEAKKFGSGRSMGRTHKTLPQKQAAQKPPQETSQQHTTRENRGLFGGVLGGLIAGGVIAAVLGGGFEGIKPLDIAVLALLAFVLFSLFRSMSRRRALAAGHGYLSPCKRGQAPSQISLFGARSSMPATFEPFSLRGSVPMNLPPNFNLSLFLNVARDNYRVLQDAWNRNDFELMSEYLEPELFEQMKAERSQLDREQHTEVLQVDAELGRADFNDKVAEISVCFKGRYSDHTEGTEADINDVWHLQRRLDLPNAPWLIVGVEG